MARNLCQDAILSEASSHSTPERAGQPADVRSLALMEMDRSEDLPPLQTVLPAAFSAPMPPVNGSKQRLPTKDWMLLLCASVIGSMINLRRLRFWLLFLMKANSLICRRQLRKVPLGSMTSRSLRRWVHLQFRSRQVPFLRCKSGCRLRSSSTRLSDSLLTPGRWPAGRYRPA